MKRITTECDKCHRHISRSNFKKHFSSCDGNVKKVYPNGYVCECTAKFESAESLGAHKGHCNKNRMYKAWNSGLTKETDKRVKQGGETYSKKILSGEINASQLGKKCTDRHKNKISETIKNKIKNGTWHLSFSHARIHEYNGIKFHGTWELKYAKWLDENNVKWRRPNEKFEYEFEGKKRFYTPDFYLIEEECYVEIKGYPVKKDFAKWDFFPLKLKILSGKNLFELKIIDDFKSRNVKYKETSWLK